MPRSVSLSALRRAASRLFLLAVPFGLAACVAQERNHGYLPSQDLLQEIVIGVDSRETVSDLIGSPTTAGILSGGNFYYVGDRTRTVGWRATEIVDRRIVAITFNEAGVVDNITLYGLADGRVVPIVRRVTETTDGDISLVRQIFGNVGGIDTSGFFDQ